MNNMNYFQKFFGHLKTVRTHRKWVRYYCELMGIGWQGFWHDLSKYNPIEFFESVKYYQGNRSPIDACKEDKGYSDAWFHHRSVNKHHRERWTDHYDKGTSCIPMPMKYALEMFADFLAAGQAYQGEDFTFHGEYNWWKAQLDRNICIHPQTAKFITMAMMKLEEYEEQGSDWLIQTLVFDDIRHIFFLSHKWWKEHEEELPYVYYGRSLDFKLLLGVK